MLTSSELDELKIARRLLESEGLALRLQNMVGKPIAEGVAWLPEKWRDRVNSAAEGALTKAVQIAIKSLDTSAISRERSDKAHKLMAAASGAVGGAFGLPALVVELPVSTTIMMRSIADIARAEGEELDTLEARLACVEVFALG